MPCMDVCVLQRGVEECRIAEDRKLRKQDKNGAPAAGEAVEIERESGQEAGKRRRKLGKQVMRPGCHQSPGMGHGISRWPELKLQGGICTKEADLHLRFTCFNLHQTSNT